MMSILDQIQGASRSRFQPHTAQEYWALRLAQKLGDAAAARHYADLAATYSQESLMVAYRRALEHGHDVDLGRRFHQELARNGNRSTSIPNVRLAAIKIERRSVAIAVFFGENLDSAHVRQLSSIRAKAEASTVGFVNWLVEDFQIESAAVEIVPGSKILRRAALAQTVLEALRVAAIPVWEVSKPSLLASFGHPTVKSRVELRRIVASFWPVIGSGNNRNQMLDAAALGIYVQTERLFIH